MPSRYSTTRSFPFLASFSNSDRQPRRRHAQPVLHPNLPHRHGRDADGRYLPRRRYGAPQPEQLPVVHQLAGDPYFTLGAQRMRYRR